MAEVSSQREFQCLQSFFPCLFCFKWVSVFKAAFLISLYLCPDLISTSSRKRWLPWTARGATYLSEWNRFLRSSRLKDCCSVRSLFFFFFLNGLFASHLFGVTVRQLTLRWFIFFSVQTPFLYLQQQMSFSALFSISLSSNQPSSHAAWKARFSALFLGCFCFCLQL